MKKVCKSKYKLNKSGKKLNKLSLSAPLNSLYLYKTYISLKYNFNNHKLFLKS